MYDHNTNTRPHKNERYLHKQGILRLRPARNITAFYKKTPVPSKLLFPTQNITDAYFSPSF